MNTEPYYICLEKFLEGLDGKKVKSLCCVALFDENEDHDCISTFQCGAIELTTIAGILQLDATRLYLKENTEEL